MGGKPQISIKQIHAVRDLVAVVIVAVVITIVPEMVEG
jgi:hypothetical protein